MPSPRNTSRCAIPIAFLLGASCCFATWLHGSELPSRFDQGVAGFYHAVKKLPNTATVLHVVAHPDDEDGALLAYCSRKLGARTLLFSLTRGEGGANLITADFFDELGALRTLEHCAAADAYGIELFYSRGTDYGYSKTLEEAQRKWQGGTPLLQDLVELIRRERPTILLSRFQGNGRDGHGHHQMAGVLSQRAYEAAADPNAFPDQLAHGLSTWHIQKLYANNINPRWRPEDADAWTLAIPTGEYDPMLGMSYAQLARYGLNFQRSQGMWGHDGDAGERPAYYRLLRAVGPMASREASVFDGIETGIGQLARHLNESSDSKLNRSLALVEAIADKAVTEFAVPAKESNILVLSAGLTASRAALTEALNHPRVNELQNAVQILRRKIAEFSRALELAISVDVDAWAEARPTETGELRELRHVTPGQSFQVHASVTNRCPLPVGVRSIRFAHSEHWHSVPTQFESTLAYNEILTLDSSVELDKTAPVTLPYWSRVSIAEPFYTVQENSAQRAMPELPMSMMVSLRVANTDLEVTRHVDARYRDPVLGPVRYPLIVTPALSVRFPLTHGLLPIEQGVYAVDVVIRSDTLETQQGTLRLDVPDGWQCDPVSHHFEFERSGAERRLQFRVAPGRSHAGSYTLRAIAEVAGQEYTRGVTTITAPGLQRLQMARPAEHTLQLADVKMAGTPHVGYIAGSGDEVAAALRMLGIVPEQLTRESLESGDLDRFDVIMVGVRAYAVREDIRTYNQRLLEFVERGGTLIVQYQTPEFDHDFGPFPYQMSGQPEEVSEEDSPVTLLAPEHRLLQYPNVITAADFEGWFEQRGSKFWKTWDDRYTPLLECHDTGQEPQRGGMLVAKYGKGTYIYSAYAWYRQLPQAVPGAYRIMANLLSQ